MLGPSFTIGSSALASYQAAIAVTGQNIANAANPDYARQTGRLAAQLGGPAYGGVTPGGGVRLSALNRHVDEALEARLRSALGTRESADTLYRALTQTETAYNELTDEDVSSLLSDFFASFSTLQTNPQDSSARNLIISSADNLIRTFDRQRDGLIGQVESLNDEAVTSVDTVNRLVDEVADLNRMIVSSESDGVSSASALRDRRDGLLRDLGSLIDIEIREQSNGGVNIYVGSEPIVQFDRARGLRIDRELVDGLEVATVRFADNNSTVRLRGGRLHGLLAARDTYVRDQLGRFDDLSRALIYEVNKLHSSGAGLVGMTAVTGEYAVRDAGAALNSDAADLPFPIQNGTLIVHVRDTVTGAMITRQIEVDLDGIGGDDTSLRDLATALNNVPGLNASVTSDMRLRIEANSGQEFWVGDDRAGAMAALGVGGFFTGIDASTIDVSDAIRADNRLIAASASGARNDADNAGRIASLAADGARSDLLGGRTIQDFHLTMVNDLAVEAAGALTTQQATDAVYNSLFAQRESISGVSLDEEAINLSRYEAAYQGAARYLTVLDSLTTEVMALI